MAVLPRATKRSLVMLLRSRGLEVPSSRRAEFSTYKRFYWLHWYDSEGVWHQAYYTAAGGRPVLSIDQKFVDITMAEVIHFGLYEEK